MPLDPQCEGIVDRWRAWRATAPLPTLAEARSRRPIYSDATRALIARTEDREIAGPAGMIPLRCYSPEQPPAGMLLYFHGGGFIAGSIEGVDGECRMLASASGCLVVSADYRLAPEHPYPAGVDDGYAALRWAFGEAERLGGLRLAVGGESAGGTIATVACMKARDRGEPVPAAQLLIYPGINLIHETPERAELIAGKYLFDPELLDWLNGHYCRDRAQFDEPYCAPVKATNLTGLPPALVIAGEYDPLRFENADYAERLKAAGVDTDFRLYPGAIHGFVGAFEIVDSGRLALSDAAAWLRRTVCV